MYYKGWAMFIKETAKFDPVIKYIEGGPLNAAVILHLAKGNKVETLRPGKSYVLTGVDVVASVHKDSNELNVPTLAKDLFLSKANSIGGTGQLDLKDSE